MASISLLGEQPRGMPCSLTLHGEAVCLNYRRGLFSHRSLRGAAEAVRVRSERVRCMQCQAGTLLLSAESLSPGEMESMFMALRLKHGTVVISLQPPGQLRA